MDCLTCSIRPVCKVYESIQPHISIANITVTDCTFKKEGVLSKPSAPLSQPAIRSTEDISKVADRIKELSKSAQTEYETCAFCKEEYETTEFTTCTDCGKRICIHCPVQDGVRTVCEDCWR